MIILNFIVFQLLWWACVLAPKFALSGAVFILVAAYTAIHLTWLEPAKQTLPLLLTALIGALLDQVGYRWGWVAFPFSDPQSAYLPLWMLALWFAFATTLNVSMRWMQGKPLLAAVLGAIFGPMAYWGAAALSVVSLPYETGSLIWIGLEWAIAMPLLLWIRARYNQLLVLPSQAQP